MNKTLVLGPVAATAYAGYEINHESGDQYYRRYTADTLGVLTDSVRFQFGLSNRHYKAGATVLIRDRFGPVHVDDPLFGSKLLHRMEGKASF